MNTLSANFDRNYKRLPVSVFITGLLLSFSNMSYSGEDYHDPETHFHKHAIGFFIGGTKPEEGDTELTIGAEYEYRFNKRIGIGGIIEQTKDGHDSTHDDGHGHIVTEEKDVDTAIIALYVHPTKSSRLILGAGKEFVDHGDDEKLFRLGANYDIKLTEKFLLAPTVNVDFIDGGHQTIVYGAALVRHW